MFKVLWEYYKYNLLMTHVQAIMSGNLLIIQQRYKISLKLKKYLINILMTKNLAVIIALNEEHKIKTPKIDTLVASVSEKKKRWSRIKRHMRGKIYLKTM